MKIHKISPHLGKFPFLTVFFVLGEFMFVYFIVLYIFPQIQVYEGFSHMVTFFFIFGVDLDFQLFRTESKCKVCSVVCVNLSIHAFTCL